MSSKNKSKKTSIISAFSYTKKSVAQAAAYLKTHVVAGLTQEQAQDRLAQYGENAVASNNVTALTILARQFRSPFVYLLIAASIVALFLGEGLDALMIVIFITTNTVIGFYQEFHADRSLALLKSYITAKTTVVRDGEVKKIAVTEVVPGDILILQAGDKVPADCRLISLVGLLVDEEILTGESATVGKSVAPLRTITHETYKSKNILFADTTIISGHARALVVATGKETVTGKINRLTASTTKESEFAKGIQRFSNVILRLVSSTIALVFLVNIIIKAGHVNIGELAIFSIALAVTIVPEALPLVSTLSLARGALAMAKKQVVVRRLSAIEDLGGMNVLCTDKTGTITENRLTVVDQLQITPRQSPIEYACMAIPKHNGKPDPFDIALQAASTIRSGKMVGEYTHIEELPFDPRRKRNTVLIKKGEHYLLITRGAPEELLTLCTNHKAVSQSGWRQRQGYQGRRVIAVAARGFAQLPKGKIAELEKDMHLVGYISFEDPIKPTAKEAIIKARTMGVAIKILTGDAAEVAGAVACKIGLIKDPRRVIVGHEFEGLSVEGQEKAIEDYSVFARVSPEQKYAIVSLLQKRHRVGFLGEGINDAPALKVAGVSLVVQSAADIARETADIIILKKSLSVIVDGISEGRMVFVNTVKYIRATLASNFGNFYAVAISSLFIDFLPMLPVQILLLNLLTDLPMIAIATDTVSSEEVVHPQDYHVRDIIGIALLLGAVSTLFDFIVFALYFRTTPTTLQTNWFIVSVVTELLFLFSIRTRRFAFSVRRPSASILILTFAVLLITVIVPFTVIGQDALHFAAPTASQMMAMLALIIGYFTATETVKLIYYKYLEKRHLYEARSR